MKSYAGLKDERLAMRFSMAEMAGILRIPKATYQGYETGRRAMPPEIIERLREWRKQDRIFMAGLPARVDAHLQMEGFGSGIPSDIVQEQEFV